MPFEERVGAQEAFGSSIRAGACEERQRCNSVHDAAFVEREAGLTVKDEADVGAIHCPEKDLRRRCAECSNQL